MSGLTWLRPRRGDVDALLVELGFNVAQAAIPVFLLIELGYPSELALSHIMPGSALAFALGALWLAAMGIRLGRREQRHDVTPHVYGSNVPAMVAFTLSVMVPTFERTHDPVAAWAMGAAAAAWTGILKMLAAPAARWLKRLIPKSAAMTVFAAAMYTYLGMVLLTRLLDSPLVGLAALALVFVTLYADIPITRYRIPGFLVVWLVPLTLAIATGYSRPRFPGLHFTSPGILSVAPLFCLPAAVSDFSIIVPLALYQIVQDIAAVEAGDTTGDHFDVRGVLVGDGLATLIGGLAGSPITNVVYSLQPPFKKLGASTAYQIWTPFLYLGLTMAGLGCAGGQVFPWPILAAITAWVAVEVGMTAFRVVPVRHHPALLFGLLLPAGYLLASNLNSALLVLHLNPSTPTVNAALEHAIYWQAVLGLSYGFLLTVLVAAAVIVQILDGQLGRATAWALGGAVLSWFGLMHASRVGWAAAPAYAIGWGVAAALIYSARWYGWRPPRGCLHDQKDPSSQ